MKLRTRSGTQEIEKLKFIFFLLFTNSFVSNHMLLKNFFSSKCLYFIEMFCFWMGSLRRSVERSISPSSGECSRQVVTTKLRGSEGMRASTPSRCF